MQGLMCPVLIIGLCITISQFTGMDQAFQCLLVPVRLGGTRSHLTSAKGKTKGVISPLSARKFGKLPTHYTPSLERKLPRDEDKNHGMFFYRDGKWELPSFSRVGQTVCQNFPVNSLPEKELEKQTDQQDNSKMLTSMQIRQLTDN